MSPVATLRILTLWDEQDGLPISMVDLTDDIVSFTYWEEREDVRQSPAYINRLPDWNNADEYVIYTGNSPRNIGFANEPFHFTEFL